MKHKWVIFCILPMVLVACFSKPATNITQEMITETCPVAIKSADLAQIIDSFCDVISFDTTMMTIRFDTTSTGQSVMQMLLPSIAPVSREEKKAWISAGYNSDDLSDIDDFVGFTNWNYGDRTMYILVRRGTMDYLPSGLVDSALLIDIESLTWRPSNYLVEDYDSRIRLYRIEQDANNNCTITFEHD